MENNTIVIRVDNSEIDAVTEKAKKLCDTLREAAVLLKELTGAEANFTFSLDN